MYLRPALFALVVSLAAACSSNPQDAYRAIDRDKTLSPAEKTTAKAERIPIGPRPPLYLGESGWLAVPLAVELPRPDSWGSSFGAYEGEVTGRATELYNLLFYNPQTQESHLLVDTCCVELAEIFTDTATLHHLASSHILYRLLKTDPGHKAHLSTLYATDRTGQRLVQVSPPGYEVQNWHPVPGARQVLLELVRDENGDSLITPADAPSLAVADLGETYPNLKTLVAKADFEAVRRRLIPPPPE